MEGLIPEQKEGKKVDLSFRRTFDTKAEAQRCFKQAYKRLLTPEMWHKLSGVLSGDFYLVRADGSGSDGLAKLNDYIKIDIPGPGPLAGKGYDWVRVEQVEDGSDAAAEDESIGIRLRPCANPESDDKNTAHFFTEKATSTFIISRKGNTVSAFYYGRNELPETKTDHIIDKVRNVVVGTGAMASLSEAQWNNLIKGFLQDEAGE